MLLCPDCIFNGGSRPKLTILFVSLLVTVTKNKCFGAVINAWSKADQEYTSAEHAEAVLDQMENYFFHEQKDKRFMLSNVAYNLGEFL